MKPNRRTGSVFLAKFAPLPRNSTSRKTSTTIISETPLKLKNWKSQDKKGGEYCGSSGTQVLCIEMFLYMTTAVRMPCVLITEITAEITPMIPTMNMVIPTINDVRVKW